MIEGIIINDKRCIDKLDELASGLHKQQRSCPSGRNRREGEFEMKKKGFTLIELMIVVVIIGILAAIAIPKFNDVSESAKRNACRANMRTIASQNVIYFAQHNRYASTIAFLGMGDVNCPSAPAGDYAWSGTISTFSIACPYGTSHGSIVNGIASWIDSGI
jgi:prepilin-type N-terminal cleavage/methylation domain-containing protein